MINGTTQANSGLNNASLNAQASNVKTVLVKYSGLESDATYGGKYAGVKFALLYSGGTWERMLFASAIGAKNKVTNNEDYSACFQRNGGASVRYKINNTLDAPNYNWAQQQTVKYNSSDNTRYTSGVACFVDHGSLNFDVYFNGQKFTNTATQVCYHIGSNDYHTAHNYDDGLVTTFGNGIVQTHGYVGSNYYNITANGYTLEAAVLYNKELTAEQIATVSGAMNNL